MSQVPSLSVLILKEIAKNPAKFLANYSNGFEFALEAFPNVSFDVTQLIIDYVTEAGRMSDETVPISFFLSSRRTLSLQNSKVSSKFIQSVISICTNLEEINLSGIFQVDDDLVLRILKTCPILERLNIRNCRKITERALQHIVDQKANISSLNLGGDVNISSQGLMTFLKSPSAAQLTELSVAGLVGVTDEALALITLHCPKLRVLSINYTDISEKGLRNALSNSPSALSSSSISLSPSSLGGQLESLHIAWIGTTLTSTDAQDKPALSSEFFSDFLPVACPRLTELDLSGLKNVNTFTITNYLGKKVCLVSLFVMFNIVMNFPKLDWSAVYNGSPVLLSSLKARFVGSSKQQMEIHLNNYPYIKAEL
jgi:hypothetical protein